MARQSKYTKEFLEPIVRSSFSVAQVIRACNLSVTGGNYRAISGKIKVLGIDTSHFTGQNWNKGLTATDHPSIASASRKLAIPDEEVFVKGSTYTNSKLYARLIKKGWPSICFICGLTEWQGKEIRLHVDHINGEHTDHRLENLRFLCPNCHQQTPTWGNYSGRVGEFGISKRLRPSDSMSRPGSSPGVATNNQGDQNGRGDKED